MWMSRGSRTRIGPQEGPGWGDGGPQHKRCPHPQAQSCRLWTQWEEPGLAAGSSDSPGIVKEGKAWSVMENQSISQAQQGTTLARAQLWCSWGQDWGPGMSWNGLLGPGGKGDLTGASLGNDVTVPTRPWQLRCQAASAHLPCAPKCNPCVGMAQEGVCRGEGWWFQPVAPRTHL